MVISSEQIFLSQKGHTRDDALKLISNKAAELDIISKKNINNLYLSLADREKVSTTGLVDGFSIPHAQTDYIKKNMVLVFKFKDSLDWPSHDGKKIKIAIVILVNKKNASNHMDILSQISTFLLDDDFKSFLLNSINSKSISSLFSKKIDSLFSKNKEELQNNFKKNIVAITGCTVGIAHTYMAAETLKNTAKKMNIKMQVETHGSSGVKNELTTHEIKIADSVIIASDISIDLERFKGKKILQTSTKEAIHNSKKIINDSFNSNIFEKKFLENNSKNKMGDSNKKSAMKHILAGISYMIPFIIFGGLMIALSLGIAKSIYGDNSGSPNGSILFYMENIGALAFTLMIPILGGFIANSIGGRAAIAPAMIVSFLGNSSNLLYPLGGLIPQSALGFIGSILFGLFIGYTVKWINTWRIHKNIQAIMPIFIIPIGVTLFYGVITIFIIGAPISWLMNEFSNSIKSIFEGNGATQIGVGIGMGILIGSMAGFDMGGPINKIAFVTCSALITENILEPMGMMAVAIPVAPLGMGLCTLMFRKYFDSEKKSMGVSAIIMGFIGISEGAIPFAISDPKRAIISNVVGSAIAGAIAGGIGLTGSVAHGGPIVGILGGIGSPQYGLGGAIGLFFLAIIVGSLVTAIMYGLLLMLKNKKTLTKESENTQIKFSIPNSIINKYRIWYQQKNIMISNSMFAKTLTKNKELISISIMLITTTWGIIIGSLLLYKGIGGYYAYNEIINNNISPEINQFPSLFNYGILCFIISIVSLISSIIYFPTLKYQLKKNDL